jgi:hypothetical protein
MEYKQLLKKIEESLFWLDANARHAIELKETFSFPAYDESIRKLIEGTNKVRCYKVCLDAIYFEFIMTLMRMYDSFEYDTVCFKKLSEYLTDDFIQQYEKNTEREVRNKIESALTEYRDLNGSHLVGRLKTVRHNMFAHTSTNFNRNQVAEYGHAEQLIDKTLPMLNKLNHAFRDKIEPYDKISTFWKGYAKEFWRDLIKNS